MGVYLEPTEPFGLLRLKTTLQEAASVLAHLYCWGKSETGFVNRHEQLELALSSPRKTPEQHLHPSPNYLIEDDPNRPHITLRGVLHPLQNLRRHV